MPSPSIPSQTVSPAEERQVRALYQRLLEHWNSRDPAGYAALVAETGSLVGFDGSPLNGRAEIQSALQNIFADHPTAAYVGKVREVRFVTPEVAILRAVAGMVPPGASDLNPAVNAIQTLVAAKREGQWQIELFQNTPAQFHGRPEMAQQLTDELRQML